MSATKQENIEKVHAHPTSSEKGFKAEYGNRINTSSVLASTSGNQIDIGACGDHSRGVGSLKFYQTKGPTIESPFNEHQILGPPENWLGPVPTRECELFVRKIPWDISEEKLIQPFLRFGNVYEIRMSNPNTEQKHGLYACIRYTNEEDAACALEVLSHFFIAKGRKLEILRHYEKRRLFVSNIPKELKYEEIEGKIRGVFPNMLRLHMRNEMSVLDLHGKLQEATNFPEPCVSNRGHAFIHFSTHIEALIAKRKNCGIIKLWGRELKVSWANTDRDANFLKLQSKTLFVRNVHLSVNHRELIEFLLGFVHREEIRKISKVRTTAFVDFTSREAAEMAMEKMQGEVLYGQRIDVEWAKASDQQSVHRMRNTDFDATLRIKCIANYWHIPVMLFGTYFELEGLQYAGILLRNERGVSRAVFCILQSHDLVDIHSRLCEVAVVLINTIGTFPDYNYVFHVQRDEAHLLGMVSHNMNGIEFVPARNSPQHIFFDYNEICDLSWTFAILSSISEESLMLSYQCSFRTTNAVTYLPNISLTNQRIIGTIMPNYRSKVPLQYHLNDSQIILALCHTSTGNNRSVRPHLSFPLSQFVSSFDGLHYLVLKLFPVSLTQSRCAAQNQIISQVLYGANQLHNDKLFETPPVWLCGSPYHVTIKQLKHNKVHNEPSALAPQQHQFLA